LTGSKPPVEPTLFDLVKSYAADITAGHVNPTKPLKLTTPIIVFCQNFFLQFFQNELATEILGVDDASKRIAARIALTLEREGTRPATLALVAWYENFCDIFPNVVALSYGGSRGFFLHFHQEHVKRLLDRAGSWSVERSYDALTPVIRDAREVYAAAVLGL
jgi:hypothetical protein